MAVARARCILAWVVCLLMALGAVGQAPKLRPDDPPSLPKLLAELKPGLTTLHELDSIVRRHVAETLVEELRINARTSTYWHVAPGINVASNFEWPTDVKRDDFKNPRIRLANVSIVRFEELRP